nr:phytase [Sphingomonas sp. dw_22]
MRGSFGVYSVTVSFLLCGCAMQATPPQAAISYPAVNVPAAGETAAVATQNADAADDPAIFGKPGGARFDFAGKTIDGLLLGTDKKAGLYVFALGGEVLQFLPDGLLNNVDLRPEGEGFVAGASARTPGRMGVALYRFDGASDVRPAGFIPADTGEPYGFCMGRIDDAPVAVLVLKDGQVRVYDLDLSQPAISGKERLRFAIGTQSEGCTVDDAAATLFVGEEDVGIWRYDLKAAPGTRISVAKARQGQLVDDVEGMSLLRDGGATYLIVSSQGDDAFAVWDVTGAAGSERYVGRFRVAPSGGVDGVSGTDGVDAWTGPIGRFGQGLVAMQDGDNDGQAQNFKLVDWAAVKAALGR